jgi:hypothetical protein
MLTLLAASVIAVQGPPSEIKQFDFWLGDWTCEGISYHPTDPKQNQKTSGQNSITREMDGFVVRENFTMGAFRGASWSVYTPANKKWRQTWVDNQGGYITLAGEFRLGKMILTTLPNEKTPKNFSRMVYSHIKNESFDWDWEKSVDAGKTWKLAWHLHYTRKE